MQQAANTRPSRHTDAPQGIGAVARASGASAKALRLYEARGLLGTVHRRGSYRIYSEDQLARLRMIRMAQSLGFRLADLQWIASGDWAEAQRQLRSREAQVEAAIQNLHIQLGRIRQAMAEIDACPELAAEGAWPACAASHAEAAAPGA